MALIRVFRARLRLVTMRSPRLIYLAAAAVLLVAALALTDWLTDRSVPDLGDGVVQPAGASAGPTTPTTPATTPTQARTTPAKPPVRGTIGADPVTPAPARTAGQDDDLDDDGVDDDLDDRTDSDGDG